MDIRCFYIRDRVAQNHLQINGGKDKENHTYSFTKHHSAAHHTKKDNILFKI